MNTPSTFIFESLNKKKLSNKLLIVFLKNFFRYGRKDVKLVNGRVHLYLSYSPKNETVEQKVRGLPIHYLRVAADDEEELQLLLQGMKEFPEVNFYQATIEEHPAAAAAPEEEPKVKKLKILENRIVKPSTSLAQYVEIFDDDADDFEAQKYHIN